MDLDSSRDRFEEIKIEFEASSDSARTEEDVRFRLINRITTEVLGSGPINPAPSARDQFLPQTCLKYEDVAGSHRSILSGFAVKNGRALSGSP